MGWNGAWQWEWQRLNKMTVRQEIDGLQSRHLQLPPSYISWGEKKMSFRPDTYK